LKQYGIIASWDVNYQMFTIIEAIRNSWQDFTN